MSLLIRSVHLADPDAPSDGLQDILVEGRRIARIAPEIEADGAEIIDGTGMIAAPGMVDTHRHIWQTAIRGVAADWSLVDYVREIRIGYATAFTADDVYVATLAGALEAIDTGVTAVCDFAHIMNSPAHAEAGLQALRDAGIRSVFCYGFYDVPSRDRAFTSHADRLVYGQAFLRGFDRAPGTLVTPGIALTEFGLVDADRTDAEIALARSADALITLHVGTFGAPHGIAALDARGRLGPDMLHVHGNLCGDEELRRVVETGGHLSVTPETEMQMGMGFPVTNRFLAAGGQPTFGVDIVSDFSGDLLTQLRIGLQTARAIDNQIVLDEGKSPDKVELTVGDALRFGTRNGAIALRLGDKGGTLRPGAPADIVLWCADGLNMAPFGDPVSMLVLQARPGDADTVLVDGCVVKRAGKLVGHDIARLQYRLCEVSARIRQEAATARDTSAATADTYSAVTSRAVRGAL